MMNAAHAYHHPAAVPWLKKRLPSRVMEADRPSSRKFDLLSKYILADEATDKIPAITRVDPETPPLSFMYTFENATLYPATLVRACVDQCRRATGKIPETIYVSSQLWPELLADWYQVMGKEFYNMVPYASSETTIEQIPVALDGDLGLSLPKFRVICALK